MFLKFGQNCPELSEEGQKLIFLLSKIAFSVEFSFTFLKNGEKRTASTALHAS